MDQTGQDLLKLLFNEGENVCVSNSKYGYHSMPLNTATSGIIGLISPNNEIQVQYCDSKDLTMIAINPIKGFRTDDNVTSFRSFLFEIDIGTIEEQLGYFKHLKIPLSAQVFSGNKSIHSAVCLNEDIVSEKTYRYLYEWALNILTNCDQACRNPSRSVRIPGAYREPGKKQELIYLGSRVTHRDFISWLNTHDDKKPKIREKKEFSVGGGDYSRLGPWARGMLRKGISFELGRNQTWYALAVDFYKAGYTEEQTIEFLQPRFNEERDFKEKEFLITISSAFKRNI